MSTSATGITIGLRSTALPSLFVRVAIDHTVKKPKKGERYAAGGAGKLGAARCQWFVVREKPFSPDRAGAITLTRAKSRAAGLAEWHRFEVGGEGVDRFSFRAVGGDVPVDRLERDIFAFVETHGAGQDRNALRKGVTGNDTAIDGTADTLVARGSLRQDHSGRYPTFGSA